MQLLPRVMSWLVASCFVTALAQAQPLDIQVLSAVVKDQRIAGASVTLQKNGEQSVSGTTDAQGKVELASTYADSADALVIIKKEGYSNLVARCPCKGLTYALSPVIQSLDGLRVVLSWGQFPLDLDSHMAYPNQHIYWQRKTGSDANLDVDDTDSYGPETVTLTQKHFGETYVYAVHDYSDRGDPNTRNLARSSAKVFVYIGRSLVRTYYVPTDKIGNLWTVFKITGEGEFQDVNQFGDINDPALVAGKILGGNAGGNAVVAAAPSVGDAASAKSLNKSGEDAYHAGDLDRAIDLYQQAINLSPEYGQAYSNLGLAYQKAGRAAEAIWANRKALALASGPTAATVRASSYYNIGRLYEAAGQFADAKRQFELARGQKPNPVYDKAIERVSAKM